MEEKVDGSQCAVGWKGGKPYAQGRSGHILDFDKRVAFDGLWNDWIWKNVDKLEMTKGYLIFGEWLKPMHSIYYDELPSFFMAFDIWDIKNKKFLNYDKKVKLFEKWEIPYLRLLHQGKLKTNDIPSLVDNIKSKYSSQQNCEGCVIKNYKTQQFLKYVTREFLEDIFDDSGHWTSRRKVKYNRLHEWRS